MLKDTPNSSSGNCLLVTRTLLFLRYGIITRKLCYIETYIYI